MKKKVYIYIYMCVYVCVCVYVYISIFKIPPNFFEVIFLRYEKQMGKESRPSWGSFSKGF